MRIELYQKGWVTPEYVYKCDQVPSVGDTIQAVPTHSSHLVTYEVMHRTWFTNRVVNLIVQEV